MSLYFKDKRNNENKAKTLFNISEIMVNNDDIDGAINFTQKYLQD